MTRTEFLDRMEDFSDLKEFCDDERIDVMDDVMDDEERDDYIYNEIHDNSDSWDDLRDWLNGIPTGYDWWERDGWGEWNGLDEDYDFNLWRARVADAAEECGIFDPEEEELEEEELESAAQEVEEPVEDFSVCELFTASSAVFENLESERLAAVAAMEEKTRAEEIELDKAFASLVDFAYAT